MPDLQVVHLHAHAFLEVGDEFGALLRDDQVDAVIQDEFRGRVPEEFLGLEHPDQGHDEEVREEGDQQRAPVQRIVRIR